LSSSVILIGRFMLVQVVAQGSGGGEGSVVYRKLKLFFFKSLLVRTNYIL